MTVAEKHSIFAEKHSMQDTGSKWSWKASREKKKKTMMFKYQNLISLYCIGISLQMQLFVVDRLNSATMGHFAVVQIFSDEFKHNNGCLFEHFASDGCFILLNQPKLHYNSH